MRGYYETYYKQVSVRTPDGMGGYITKTGDGDALEGVYIVDNSTPVRIAAAQGIKVSGRFVTTTDAPVAYNDIIRRVRDSVYFKITGEAKQSPLQAESQFKYFEADITTKPPS